MLARTPWLQLGVPCVEEHGIYLGLPIHMGSSKSAIFSFLKEQLTKKLVSWRTKILSSVGKEILIKVVAQTVPLYVMNCYMLPKNLCEELYKRCAQFFWGGTELLMRKEKFIDTLGIKYV